MPAGIPAEVFGPVGALALAIVVIVGLTKVVQKLWDDHLRADADDRRQRDEAFGIAHAQVEATQRVADSYADIAKEVAQIAKEVAAVRRDMAARRRNDR